MGFQIAWALVIGLPSAIWLVGLILWRRSKPKPKSDAASDMTVVVAARNEEQHIGAMLASVLGQDSIGPVPVILVDDHSQDRTREIAEAMGEGNPRLSVVVGSATPPNFGAKKYALHQGLSLVHTKFIALTDADCRAPLNWLSSLREEIGDRTGAILGASLPPRGHSFAQFMYRAERLTANCVMASSCGWGSPSSACGHNLMYRTTALQEAGGFAHPELPSGDDDLTVQAIARKKWKIRFASSPQSVVTDCGGTGRASRWQSASRHQSVLKFYPLHWRALFAWSVAAHVTALASVPAYAFGLTSSGFIVGACALFVLDITCGVVLSRRLRLDVKTYEIFFGALLLPFWTIWRAAAAMFGAGYTWRGRSYSEMDATGAGA